MLWLYLATEMYRPYVCVFYIIYYLNKDLSKIEGCTHTFLQTISLRLAHLFFIHADRETVPFAASFFKLSLIFCRLSVVWHLGFTPITKIELVCKLVSGNVTNNFVEITYMRSQATLKSANGEHTKKESVARSNGAIKRVLNCTKQ